MPDPIATTFTPFASLFGGALIGLAATLLLLSLGRVFGVTGIVGGLFTKDATDITWRPAILAGMIIAPVLFRLATGAFPTIQVAAPLPVLIGGGLAVGFGAALGSGCTSGHGVCGLARLSPRSLAATVTFMFAAGMTVFVVRHVIGG